MNNNSWRSIKKYRKNTNQLSYLILFILGFALIFIPNAMGANYNITNETELNANFTNANSSDILTITNNITLNANTNQVVIGGFSIEGNGSTISGNNSWSIINLGTKNISSINNITLTQGNATNGGAIIAVDLSGTIENSTLSNNNATNNGGAIFANYLSGNIASANFTNNTANYGGAIYVNGADLSGTITNSIFSNNTATNDGGAIYVSGDLSGTITNSIFSNNSATAMKGGAIYVKNDLSGTITNSIFSNNTAAAGDGGAIWINSLSGNITNSSFINNTATNLGGAINIGADLNGTIINSNFTGNIVNDTGGAIYVGADLRGAIINSNFTSNIVDNSYSSFNKGGGAIYVLKNLSGNIINSIFFNNTATTSNTQTVDGGAIYVLKNLSGNITNSNFTGNTAQDGGAIFVSNDLSGNITSANFTNNNATNGFGGAIYVNHNLNGNITNSIFANNTATKDGGAISVQNELNGNITNSSFNNNTATWNGGAIYSIGALSGNITNSIFSNNTATKDGGAIYVNSDLNGTIANSNFTNNTANDAGYGGGAIHVKILGGNITNDIFANNNAKSKGGAIYVDTTLNGTITNSIFNNNTANDTNFGGGAIFVNNTLSGNIINSNFTNNNATWNGGAIYVNNGALSGNITNSIFANNNATNNGGAIFVYNDLSGTITNSNFTSNNAQYGGGAIEVDGSLSGNITNSNFTSNNAQVGGAIFVQKDLSGIITNSIFNNNIATTGAGGAIYVQKDLSGIITNDIFTNNNAQVGGAIRVSVLNGTITNSIFTNNNATNANYGGGAIFVYNDLSGIITNSNFTSNNAQYGGAIFVNTTLSGNIANSIFTSNNATGWGGAIDVNGSLSGIITNSNFTSNTANINGGAIYVGSLNGTIANSIFNNNTATAGDGGAIYIYGKGQSNFTISTSAGKETIFQNNMDSNGANSIYFDKGGAGIGGNVDLTLTGAGTIKLLDPMRAEMTALGQTLTINRDNSGGNGSLVWGGINRLAAANSVNVNLTAGYTELQKDFSLVANNSKMIVNMGVNHDLALNTAGRNSSLAAFDFTQASAGSSFNIASTTNIVSPRSFLVSNGTYLLVDNTTDAVSLQPKFLVQNSPIFKADVLVNGTQLWLTTWYNPYVPPTPNPNPVPNPYNAQTALEQWLLDTIPGTTLSDSNFRALLHDIRSTVPEHIMDSALIAFNIHRKVVNSALTNAFGKGTSADLSLSVNNFASLGLVNEAQTSTQKATPIAGLHLWTGYIGNFQNVDKNKGYAGYDVNTNGLLLGGTYDIGEKLAVGAFGGYSHSSVDFDGMHANGDTDGSHFGLFGRYIADCGIATTLDTAYSHFSNSYTRTPDGLTASSADYGQDAFSLGLGFNYDYLPVKNLRISPYVNARSTWLKQDSVNENGPLGAHLNSLNANSFTTNLGATIAYDSIFSDKAMLTSSLLLGYMHEFGDDQLSSNANFLAPTLDNAAHIGFVVKSDKQGRDVFQTGLSFDGKFTTKNGQNWGLTASYGLEIRDHSTTNSVYAGVHFDF